MLNVTDFLSALACTLCTCLVAACTSSPWADAASQVSTTARPTSPAAQSAPLVATTPPSSDPYRLVFSDEFNTDGPPNTDNWTYEEGFVRNQELQWYQRENATCKNGRLIIEARRETKTKPNPTYIPGSTNWKTSRQNIEYTSACLTTKGKHTWQYGRFVMRARIDTRAGSWPAFWTLGTTGRWPAGGEIDIMEYYQKTLLANVAWGGTSGARWHTVKKPLTELPPDFSNQFHTWRMDWTKDSIHLYCDDMLLNSTNLADTINATPAPSTRPASTRSARFGGSPEPGVNPFTTRPLYLLLNQAIGGGAGGDPSKTQFPVRFEVDFVRVYQIPGQADPLSPHPGPIAK